MSIVIVFIAFFVFLFVLYYLAHDDFVLLRRDILVEKVFNLAILVILGSVFFARLVYAVLSSNPKFINPLIFFSFFKHPGFSLIGGVLGGILFLLLFAKYWKMPTTRLFDFFAVSFLCAWGIMGIFAFNHIVLFLFYIIIFLLFVKFILPKLMNGKLKEGSMGFLFLIVFSTASLLNNFIPQKNQIFSFKLTSEDFLLSLMLIVSIAFILKQKNFLKIFNKLKK